MLPSAEDTLMVVTLEAPNFEYMDEKSAAINTIALLEKNTIETLDAYNLKKNELPNCLYFFEKRSSMPMLNSSSSQLKKYVLVGTAFMDLNENLPTKGRVLIFEIDTSKKKMILRHIEQVNGSVQAVATLKEDHKYLILGINNQIQLHSMTVRPGSEFKLVLI